MFILQIGGWFIFSCILMSFIEHQVHRKLMHRRSFLSARTASFKRVLRLTLLCITSTTPRYSAMTLSLVVKTRRYG